jgi:hypothetical protein
MGIGAYMVLTKTQRIAIAPDVLYQELDGESVLLNLTNETYFGLDDVGTRIWQLLVEQGNVEAVLAQMQTEYEVDEVTLQADLTRLLAELNEAGLVSFQE